MQNEMQEHPADENAPSTGRTSPLMNVPAADIVDAGASAAEPRDVDPAEVAILAEAEDPGTSGLRLQELATDEPKARPAVAANPVAGPELLKWLGALDDPAVNAALRRREQAQQAERGH
ncbi:hypothetical protein KKR91_03655 [Arthrobacter jiangjiafuii]|uniref:Leucine rich repeat variant domain-containing protein n=1 Tax=Arthrobacter jiangjiafuii TaxID=2817475 RepID=A0A975M6B7_9MICC|nr:hypothetical protein [Arthrobacter jiangjiafuii]MBP3043700.1 hypothetical protein [Arthrobacter jiangjiafuii]QWC10732.1 hypothetical protein KKR91_03655 [Arthrobacter jiangjiafuii]